MGRIVTQRPIITTRIHKTTTILNLFILVIKKMIHKFCFTISLFRASTCFEHHVLIVKICFTISLFRASTCFELHVLMVRRSKLYFTASGIITPIGVMIPEVVLYNFDLLTMSTWCSKHVEAWNKLIVKQILCIKLVNY